MRLYLRYDDKGNLKEYAKITNTANGQYGYKTRLHGSIFTKQYKLNANMPVFNTKKEAEMWIESNNDWK